jgi:hypothetical protein
MTLAQIVPEGSCELLRGIGWSSATCSKPIEAGLAASLDLPVFRVPAPPARIATPGTPAGCSKKSVEKDFTPAGFNLNLRVQRN